MKLIDDHIKSYLEPYIKTPDVGFANVFSNVPNGAKEKAKKLLIYLDKLINSALNKEGENLKYTHIHLECIDSELLHLITQFIIVKFFFRGINIAENVDGRNYNVDEINKINAILSRPRQIPTGAKGGSKKDRDSKLERQNLAEKKCFYDYLMRTYPAISFKPQTLLNVTKNEYNVLKDRFQIKPLAVPIENIPHEQSHVVMNFEKTRDKIDEITLGDDQFFLDLIKNVILIDCEQKKVTGDFNYKDLKNWNDNGSDFHNLIIISVNDGKHNFNKLKNRLFRIQSKFYSEPKYPHFEAYTILPFEINLLQDKIGEHNEIIRFYGDNYCSFWENFKIQLTYNEGLYELQSLKMMNVYSLLINENLKNMVIEDIFSFRNLFKIISQETISTLQELSNDSIKSIKSDLLYTIDWIISSDWSVYLRSQIAANALVILPQTFIANNLIITEFRNAMMIKSENIHTWFDIDIKTSKNIVVLEYRDLGPFPYTISPSIFEKLFQQSDGVRNIFLALFFENKFEWTRFNLSCDVHKILSHPTREKYLEWNDLDKELQRSKPNKPVSINWDAENKYQNQETVTIKVKFKGGNKRSFIASELFITQLGDADALKVSRLEDLIDWNYDQTSLKIQMLDDLYSEINIYDKIANVERENSELQVIRKEYAIANNENASRLWKVLLKRKSDEKGVDKLYEEIEIFMKENGIGLVSKGTFENSWTNPDSDSLVPRSKSVFSRLCDYLGLPKSYYRLMLRLKNVEMQATRSSSKQMNGLLSDLINDDCFCENINVQDILLDNKKKYLKKHDFDEIGIAEDQVVNELKALVALLKPYMKLVEVQKIEMN
jgi:hypothetical protein